MSVAHSQDSAKYACDDSKLAQSFDEKIKDLTPSEQEAVRNFWRSVVMRTPRAFNEENGRLPHGSNVRSCNCCPYGYHIDLDFVRYCEALANAKPSEEELRRRSRRRSRKSMEFMLGLESLFDQWDANERVQAVPEASHESDSPDSLRLQPSASTPYCHRPRSSSVPRFTYGGLTRSESPFGTASSTCSSYRGGVESDVPYSMRRPANSPPETRAFLHDALDEVCSDFERTLERTSQRRKKADGALSNSFCYSNGSDRNNNKNIRNGYSCTEKRNCQTWEQYFQTFDSCVTGNKSPRSSRYYSKSTTLPFQQRQSPAEQQYESYVQATVAANAKSPVELITAPTVAGTPPPPPPRRHAAQTKVLSPSISTLDGNSLSSEKLLSPTAANHDGGAAAADAQTLFNIRQQMALSLKRMKDLEEQVKTIPELQHELNVLRNDKDRLNQTLLRKEDELQRARETSRISSTPSPVASPKYTSPAQFTPQRISPVSLESLGARLRTSSTSSDKQARTSLLKRDVGTMCGLHATRDIAVGSPVITLRTVGTSPKQLLSITELLYTKLELEQHTQVAIQRYEEQRSLQRLKQLISVGTQMFVPKLELRDSGAQTAAEQPVQKFSVAISAKPMTRENYTICRPDVRSIGSSEDRISDELCEKCAVAKRHVACSTEDAAFEQVKAVSLRLLDMPGRSNTFSLGDNERLNLIRKSTGTQYTPVVVHSAGCQTSGAVTHAVGVQITPETQSASTQSHVDQASRQTDTRGLICLRVTQTNTEEIKPVPASVPAPVVAPVEPVPVKPQTRTTGSNTEVRKTSDNGVNTLPPASIRHSSSNTEEVRKRDAACGDIVKPHISIACADNYCDSCKDAIKNLAKDFSKVLASPVPTRAADSRIPRPKHLTSPSPVRRQFKRQNTYTITPSPTPSPVTEKRMTSSLHEKPPSPGSFHQIEASAETQNFISEQATARRSSNVSVQRAEELEAVFASKPAHGYEPSSMTTALDDLIVKEETRVRISWSRDASPAPLAQPGQKDDDSPLKSLENSFSEKLKESMESTGSSNSADVSKGARKKSSPIKSSQSEDAQKGVEEQAEKEEEEALTQKPPSKALLQKLAMVEAEPRIKTKPNKDMLAALKIINDSLLKRMGAKSFSSSSLKAAKTTIQQEWFRISSTDKANPHEVEDYLDCFEEMSVPLLEYCVNLVDVNGNTAMHYAVSHGNFDVVSILLDSKVCNVNQMNNAGYTCVMLVSLAKLKNAAHRTVVERLFQMADVNIRAKKHCQTALMLAVSHGNLDMVEMLLAAGADINIQDEDGSTALMCAAEHGRGDIVKHLLSQTDCDSLIQDMDGSTAFKIAWQAGHRDIGLLLYVHEQMLRSKLPNRGEGSPRTPTAASPRHKRQPSQ